MLWRRMLADLIVVVHAAYVGFVVLGLRRDPGRHRLPLEMGPKSLVSLDPYRMIGIVVAEALAGIPCPLTVWERQLRQAAGQVAYAGDFIGYWTHRLLFFRAEPWVFTVIYAAFGLAVLAAFILAPPRWRRTTLRRPTV